MITSFHTKYFAVIVSLMLIAGESAKSQTALDTDKTPMAFSQLQMSLPPGAATLGDTLPLTLAFQANVSGPAVLHLHFPGLIAPPDQGVGETDRDSNIVVDSGFSYTYIIPMKIYQYGGSLLEAAVRMVSPIQGYQNFTVQHLEIQNYLAGSFSVLNQGNHRNDSATFTYDTPTGNQSTLHISGQVLYQDMSQINNPTKGVLWSFCYFAFP